MKTNFKRLFTLLLTLCMLASLMVPVAFAEDEAVAAPSANVAETYPIRLKDLSNHDANAAVEGTYDYLMTKANMDTEDDLTDRKWTYSTKDLTTPLNNAYASKFLNWNFYAYGVGAEVGFRGDAAWQLRIQGKNAWNALKIRVSNPGAYALQMTTDRNSYEDYTNNVAGWTGDISAYLIPLYDVDAAIAASEATETQTATQVAIESLMVDKYFVGTYAVSKSESTFTFDTIRMEADEYILVYKVSASNLGLSEIALVGEAYEKEEVATYDLTPFDFDLPLDQWAAHTYNKLICAATETEGVVSYTFVKAYALSKAANNAAWYNDLGWKYLSTNSSAYDYREATAYMPRLKDEGAYAALQINVPESGKMYLSMTVDKTLHEVFANAGATNVYNGAAKTPTISAYLIPLADVNAEIAVSVATETRTATQVAYESLIADNTYFVGAKKMLAEESSVTFNIADLEAGEYAVVYLSTDSGTLGISEMKLEKLAADEIGENDNVNSQHIDLGLYNIKDPIYDQIVTEVTNVGTELIGADGVATTIRAYADAQYAAGLIDWKIETYAADFTDANFTFKTKDNSGLYINTPDTAAKDKDWFALRLRVDQGDFYNLSMKLIAGTCDPSFYLFPADAEAMSAEDVLANMIPENGIYYQYKANKNNQKISLGYLEGEYILIVNCPYGKARSISLNDIVLESEKLTAEDVQTFNFRTFEEGNPYYGYTSSLHQAVTEEVTEEVVNPETGETTTETKTVTTFVPIDPLPKNIGVTGSSSAYFPTKWDADGNVTELGNVYKLIYQDNGAGYPNNLNWRPDAGYSPTKVPTNLTDSLAYYTFGNTNVDGDDGALKMGLKNTTGNAYGSVMLRVEKAGTYDVMIKGGYYGFSSSFMVVDAFVTDYGVTYGSANVKSYVDGEKAPLLKVDSISVPTRASDAVKVAQITVDTAGDYLFAFGSNAHVRMDAITLVPVIEEVAAGVAGETYATVEEAIEAAEEGDTINLLDTLNAEEVVVPAGVTLNLNGNNAFVDVIDASAPGAEIVDPFDGMAALYAEEVIFNENNPQLPLKDKLTGAYYLYNVDVVSSATTGKGSSTKYWFKVNFSNDEALDKIGVSTELRMNAKMTGIYKETEGENAGKPYEAIASATAGFTGTWKANSSAYIVFYIGGTGDFYGFNMTPAVSANGVMIGGSAMGKG